MQGELSEPLLEDNEIYEGRSCGVLLHEDAGGVLRRNKIHNNTKEGIRQKEPKKAVLEDNVSTDNNGGT
jgi:parallel beta-helix repeat protein